MSTLEATNISTCRGYGLVVNNKKTRQCHKDSNLRSEDEADIFQATNDGKKALISSNHALKTQDNF